MIVRSKSDFHEVEVLGKIVAVTTDSSDYFLPLGALPREKPTILFCNGCLAFVLGLVHPPYEAHGQSPAGRWRGEWTSQSTGHRGPMRANVHPQSDGTYAARFIGRFFVVIPFTYRATLVPTAPGSPHLTAEKELGPILGSYRMQTSFGPNSMHGNFQAAKDQGTVRMTRVR